MLQLVARNANDSNALTKSIFCGRYTFLTLFPLFFFQVQVEIYDTCLASVDGRERQVSACSHSLAPKLMVPTWVHV